MAGIELGTPYYFYSPDWSEYFVLNAPADPNFVGYVTDITGLDDAGVRENAQVVVAGDGGYHGPFWRDRRPWTMSGIIWPTLPVLARDRAQESMERIFGMAMQQDCNLWWQPADGIARWLPFRKQQPVRMTKGQSNVEKTFQLAAVTADYRIRAAVGNTVTSVPGGTIQAGGSSSFWNSNHVTVNSIGNTDASPIITVYPNMNQFQIRNLTTQKAITVNLDITTNVTIDLTGPYPTVIDSIGRNWYGTVNPTGTDWSFAVVPGVNDIYVWELTPQGSGNTAGAGTYFSVTYRDSWL